MFTVVVRSRRGVLKMRLEGQCHAGRGERRTGHRYEVLRASVGKQVDPFLGIPAGIGKVVDELIVVEVLAVRLLVVVVIAWVEVGLVRAVPVPTDC